jgi:hypothetical protein
MRRQTNFEPVLSSAGGEAQVVRKQALASKPKAMSLNSSAAKKIKKKKDKLVLSSTLSCNNVGPTGALEVRRMHLRKEANISIEEKEEMDARL